MQDVLTIPNEVAAELAGVSDSVLEALRERLACTIRLRGNRLTLDGDKAEVAQARTVIEEIVGLVEDGQEVVGGRQRALQPLAPEHLRGLRQGQPLEHNRAADFVLAQGLDGVHRNNTDDRGPGLGGLVDDLFDGGQVDERPHGIVHGDQVDIRPDHGQRVLDGFLAGLATLHQAHRLTQSFLREQVSHPSQVVGAQRYDDLVHQCAGDELPYGMQQDGRAFQQHKLLAAGPGLLGGMAAHPGPEAGGGQDDGDSHS